MKKSTDKHYKKYLVEIPDSDVDRVCKQLVYDLFDNELDIQVDVKGIEE